MARKIPLHILALRLKNSLAAGREDIENNLLSKSRLLAHRQCPKRLWLEVNAPTLSEDASSTQAAYAAGNRLGEVARSIFDPEGIGCTFDVPADGVATVITKTKVALSKTVKTFSRRKPLFEAGFEAAGARVFVDVLVAARHPDDDGPHWAMVEVKSSTSIKDVHLEDVAIQFFTAISAGLLLDWAEIAYVDSMWVYTGEGYEGLLKTEDVTPEVQAMVGTVPDWIKAANAVLARTKAPVIRTGAQCSAPYPCGFLAHCLSQEPAIEHPVVWLPRVQTKALRAHVAKPTVRDMRDVPDALLNPTQLRVKRATLTGKKYFNAKATARALTDFAGPYYFLDFETIADVVPRWTGTRAYQQIPFQFSLHWFDAAAALHHAQFIDLSGEDPRLDFAKALVKACGGSKQNGTIFTYNMPFEAGRIRELVEYVGEKTSLGKSLAAIGERLADLAPIVREHFYHPSQQGSFSLKAVLPALVPHMNYENLDGVKSGQDAQLAYVEAVDGFATNARIRELHTQLTAYCAMDTLALVEVWRALSKAAWVR